jgi:hypothetical protein
MFLSHSRESGNPGPGAPGWMLPLIHSSGIQREERDMVSVGGGAGIGGGAAIFLVVIVVVIVLWWWLRN